MEFGDSVVQLSLRSERDAEVVVRFDEVRREAERLAELRNRFVVEHRLEQRARQVVADCRIVWIEPRSLAEAVEPLPLRA